MSLMPQTQFHEVTRKWHQGRKDDDKAISCQRLGQWLMNNFRGPQRMPIIDPEVFYKEDHEAAAQLFQERYVICDPQVTTDWAAYVKQQGYRTVNIEKIINRIVAIRFHKFVTRTDVFVLLNNGAIESGFSKPVDPNAWNDDVGRFWAWKDLVNNLYDKQAWLDQEEMLAQGQVDLTSLVNMLR